MPIYFRNMPVREPFIFDSVGNAWKQERVVRPMGYPLYHYLQTEKGKGKIEIQGSVYELKEGEGVLIAPFVSHSYGKDAEQWETLFATVTGTLENTIGDILGGRQVILTEREQGEQIRQEVQQIIKMYEKQPLDEKALSIACYGFLMNFVDGIHGEERKKEPLYQRYVEPVIKEIETHYGEKLTAAELCRLVYVTPQYLSRLFRRFLGCSVYEYLTSYRVTKAKELLLRHPRMEIQNIAHQTGFEDASHFSAMFRKMTGMTPAEFRSFHKNRT